MERIVKENYYLDIAETVLERSTCLRRQYGAIIVRNDEIVATGYNGAPRGRKNCSDLGYCVREQMRVPRGERYELCRSVHAEANAIISASRNECIGGDIYLVGHDAKTGAILSDATSCGVWSSAIRKQNSRSFRCRTGSIRTIPWNCKHETGKFGNHGRSGACADGGGNGSGVPHDLRGIGRGGDGDGNGLVPCADLSG